MALPQAFPDIGEQVIASYDFTDIATGKATKIFYAGDASAGKLLYPSATFYSIYGGTGSGNNGAGDHDFDISIEQPMIIEGLSVVNIPIIFEYNGGSTATLSSTITAKIRKVAGGVETEIASHNIAYTQKDPTPSGERQIEVVAISITVPRTKLAAGNTLRLTITTSAAGANTGIVVVHDPANRSSSLLAPTNTLLASTTPITYASTTTTQLTFGLPIVIDL